MSKSMPWLDIYPVSIWDEYVQQYKKGKLAFSPGEPVKKKNLLDFFKLGSHVSGYDKTIIDELTKWVKLYHGMDKRDKGQLSSRIQVLKTIYTITTDYLAREKKVTRDSLTSQERKKARDQDYSKEMNPEYKSNDSMGYLMDKLARRAKRKAEYIAELKKHLDEGDKGFTGYDNLLAYIEKERNTETLVGMQPDVMMERLDPWHRSFEMVVSGHSRMAKNFYELAFMRWSASQEANTIPFFLWLEGNFVCTGIDDGSSKYAKFDKAEWVPRMVTYESGANSPHLVRFAGGCAYSFLSEGGSEEKSQLMDVCPVQNAKTMGAGAYAYVWTKDGMLLCGAHEGNKFHHSSFTSGSKVRCAGMIRFVAGKVDFVSNDSGHYKPPIKYLDRFVDYLLSKGVVLPGVTIYDASRR